MMAASPLRAARCATPLREAPRSSMSATLSRYLMVLGLLVVLATLLPAAVAHGDHGGHDHGHGDGNVHSGDHHDYDHHHDHDSDYSDYHHGQSKATYSDGGDYSDYGHGHEHEHGEGCSHGHEHDADDH
mmetsp:Transcript_1097/g.1575  ORF Transcript_1097/g.1575 Transcript_1097/m.1575 type:complete len:129 (+) Transcript_1097:107-493(+)